MFLSFNDTDFNKAIENRDFLTLKSYIISSIRYNPQFLPLQGASISEAEMALNILRERVKEIFENYKKQDKEIVISDDESVNWSKEYFIEQTFWLGENFCEERIERIKKIGKKISEDKKIREQVSHRQGQSSPKRSANNSGQHTDSYGRRTQYDQEREYVRVNKKRKKSIVEKLIEPMFKKRGKQ